MQKLVDGALARGGAARDLRQGQAAEQSQYCLALPGGERAVDGGAQLVLALLLTLCAFVVHERAGALLDGFVEADVLMAATAQLRVGAVDGDGRSPGGEAAALLEAG